MQIYNRQNRRLYIASNPLDDLFWASIVDALTLSEKITKKEKLYM